MTYQLYLLPLSLKYCKPIDATDAHYLNQIHAPLIKSFKKILYIEIYNENSLTNRYRLPHHHSLINMLPSNY